MLPPPSGLEDQESISSAATQSVLLSPKQEEFSKRKFVSQQSCFFQCNLQQKFSFSSGASKVIVWGNNPFTGESQETIFEELKHDL